MGRVFFFFNDTATTEIYTLSLHDALPISAARQRHPDQLGEDRQGNEDGDPSQVTGIQPRQRIGEDRTPEGADHGHVRSEEHTSELQSRQYLVCRLLLEKKINTTSTRIHTQ